MSVQGTYGSKIPGQQRCAIRGENSRNGGPVTVITEYGSKGALGVFVSVVHRSSGFSDTPDPRRRAITAGSFEEKNLIPVP